MRKYDEITNRLESDLEILESERENILEIAEEGIKISRRALILLKNSTTKKFKSESDEIHFFKHIKPQIFSKLIYYQKLFNIESKRPRSSNKSQVKYFNKHIDRLQNYFNDHRYIQVSNATKVAFFS